MTQFANLPDDCYYLIFVRLSTSTLLSCRSVSRAWLRNQILVCKLRRTLILLQGNSPTKFYTDSHFQGAFISHGIDQYGQQMDYGQFLLHNQVNVLYFNKNVTHFLAETFPNLDTLIIVQRIIYSQDAIKPLINLLQLFSSQMVTLKMYFAYRGEPAEVINPNILKVIRQLNLMTALEHVTLESNCFPGESLKVNLNDFEFLTRVKEFYCYATISESWHDVLRQLEQTGSVSQLEHIGLGPYKCTEAPGQSDGPWSLANRFTHFPCYINDMHRKQFNVDNLPHFEQTIALFSFLTSFTIDHNRHLLPSESLASKLTVLSSHCTSLVHVRIFVNSRFLFDKLFDLSTLKPLESVKALDLVFGYDHDYNRINLQAQIDPLVHTFPSLSSIKIINLKSRQNRYADCVTFFHQLKAAFGRESLRTVYRQEYVVDMYTN